MADFHRDAKQRGIDIIAAESFVDNPTAQVANIKVTSHNTSILFNYISSCHENVHSYFHVFYFRFMFDRTKGMDTFGNCPRPVLLYLNIIIIKLQTCINLNSIGCQRFEP